MSDPKLISPMLDGFAMGSPISDHDGVKCCPAVKENSDNKYIVKIISIPASQTQLDAFLLTGAYKDPADAMEYFKETVDGLEKEAQLLQKLSKLEGFLPYDSWQVEPMDENRLGYEIYLISSYKRSLEKFMHRNPMTHLGAVNLGLDICTALAIARRAGHIYVDLKPTNIFISENREYRIGDLGFLELANLKYASLPGKYRSPYTAPELQNLLATVNTTADTYALGMILYQIYNNGVLPLVDPDSDEPLPFPVNADYEMAEIIAKATAPKVQDRYADPTEMGQALVAYMQRNRVNDTPITPPAAEPLVTGDAPILEANGNFFDESAPSEEDAADVPAEYVTEETGSMLDHADLLISDVPLEEESAQIPDGADAANAGESDPEDTVSEENPDVAIPVPTETASEDTDGLNIPIPPLAADEEAELDSEEFLKLGESEPESPAPADEPKPEKKKKAKKKAKKKKKKKGGLILIILLILLGLLAAGGYYYYDNYYLQTIRSIQVEGEGNEMTVILDTDTDNSLLTVFITDTYGNTQKSAVSGNQASFGNLLPGTLYKIRVEIDGFHALHPKGVATHGYTTDSQTKIVSFTAKTGSEDGSVVLNFAVEGPSAENWIIHYSTAEGEVMTHEFSGHMTTITGLTVGQTYTFQLQAVGDLILLGENTLEFTAREIILAEDLMVTEFTGTSLSVSWQAPAESSIDGWTVRCYSESDYDKTLTTTQTSATFTDIDATKAYTLEVLASGMTNPARLSITANPYNVSNVRVEDSDPSRLTVSWDSGDRAPEKGWLLKYVVDGSSNQGVAQSKGNTAVIQPRIPGATYAFEVISADGNSVFGGEYTYECPNASIFEAEDFLVSKDDISRYLGVNMLVTPAEMNWTNSTVSQFTTSFAPGQKASMLLHLNTNFLIRDLDVDVLFVIRNAEGDVLTDHVAEISTTWSKLWYPDNYQYCELDIPSIPTAPGEYTLYLYFNNAAVTTVKFTVTE